MRTTDLFYEETLSFVENYDGPLLNMFVTGAGASLVEIERIPGASSVIHSIHAPYSEPAVAEFVGSDCKPIKSVSAEMAARIIDQLVRSGLDSNEQGHVVVTGALTTNRWRKGPNHAYIGIHIPSKGIGPRFYHIHIQKDDEEVYKLMSGDEIVHKRRNEDFAVALFVMKLLENDCKIPRGDIDVLEPIFRATRITNMDKLYP